VQVVIEADDDGSAVVHEVTTLERQTLRSDTLGLQVAEAKEMLGHVQEVIIEEQVRRCLAQRAASPEGRPRSCRRAR